MLRICLGQNFKIFTEKEKIIMLWLMQTSYSNTKGELKLTRKNYQITPVDLHKKAEDIVQEKESLSSENINDELNKLSIEEMKQIIYELKIYQAEIETTMKNYYDLYEKAPVGYLTLDEKGIIENINLTSAKLMNREKRELLEQPFHRFIVSHDQDELYFKRKKLFETGKKQTCELRLNSKIDSLIWVQLEMTRCWDFQNKKNKYRIVMVDITERKKADKALSFCKQKHKADKFESMSILAGGLAHEMNNYLATLWANISYSFKHIDDPDKVLEKLENMQKIIQRAKNLTQNILIYAEKKDKIKKYASVENAVTNSMELALGDYNINVHLELEENLPLVKIEEEEIFQALYNIMANAAQAIPIHGNIWIDVHIKHITEKEEIVPSLTRGKYIKISITDDGEGISKDYLEKICDPFFTTKIEGSGLGLATATTIFQNHGGYTEVNSEEGKGTTFNVYIPA